ncbi:HXXEE domain-containing protein [Levilactobacillus brevis]|uniref:HXXEE domain-containing protein n=1 Tax=Levilactobacillus brevis TaxID=1580 RepID=UPI001BAC924B|nr:HXXEE domain-containing protein [Levilactobacillus brevis]MBS0979102.1 HXXEE domain-containing protein [Levilactobacillus brevis]
MESMKLLALLAPLAYLLHCTEEFAFPGGFISWYHSWRPSLGKQKPSYYWRVNIIVFLIVAVTGWFAFFTKDNNSGLVISTSFLASNTIFTHIIGAIKTHSYSPGMITGIILYLPICVICYFVTYTLHLISISNLCIYIIIAPLYELWNWYKYRKLSKE